MTNMISLCERLRMFEVGSSHHYDDVMAAADEIERLTAIEHDYNEPRVSELIKENTEFTYEIDRVRDRLAAAEQHIRNLIPLAQHAEYSEGDSPMVTRAGEFLRQQSVHKPGSKP